MPKQHRVRLGSTQAPASKNPSRFSKSKEKEARQLQEAEAVAANSKSNSPDPVPPTPPQRIVPVQEDNANAPPPPPPTEEMIDQMYQQHIESGRDAAYPMTPSVGRGRGRGGSQQAIPPPPPNAPPPPMTYAAAANQGATQTMKIQPELRAALKSQALLGKLGLEQSATLPYGSQASAADGHQEARSYPTYGNFADISALAEGCSGWLRVAMMRARVAVLVVRTDCSLPSVLLLAGVPSDRALGSQTKGWLRRSFVVSQSAPHSLTRQGPTRIIQLPAVAARPVHKLSGKAESVLQFARDFKLRFAQESRFGEELHVIVDLTHEEAMAAIMTYHLLAMEARFVYQTINPELMLTIDFERHINAQRATTIINEIGRQYQAFAAVTSFRGRLLLGAPPGEQLINAIFQKYNGAIKSVRPPFAATKPAPAQDTMHADEAVVPDVPVQGPAVLLESDGALPPNYVDLIMHHVLGPNARLLNFDGRTALVAVPADVSSAVDGSLCGPVRISDFVRVRRDRDDARARMRASLERGFVTERT